MKENQLELLMQELFQDSSRMGDFYGMLLSSELFVLTAKADVVEGRSILKKETEVELINYHMEDGTPFVPIFTSLSELERSIPTDLSYMSLKVWNLFSIIRGSHIVINPASELGLQLDPDNIEEILHHFGATETTIDSDTTYQMGLPVVDPVDFKNALSEVFRGDSRIHSAYFCLMINQKSGNRSFLVGVVFRPEQEYRGIFNIAGPAAGKFLPEDHNIDFIVIDDSDPEGFAGTLLQNGECFFRAETDA